MYRVFKINKLKFISVYLLLMLMLGCDQGQPDFPEVETYTATIFDFTSVRFTGEVFSRGGSNLIARGFCYSKTTSELENNCLSAGDNRLGKFHLDVSDLEPETSYYFKAYAENEDGIGYGTTQTFLVGEQANWLLNYQGETNFNSISFMDENQGIAVGKYGIAYTTSDGGDNWNQVQLINTGEDLIKVKLFENESGWIVGSQGSFWTTYNGGNTWNVDDRFFGEAEVRIGRVDGFDGNHIAFSSGVELFITSNGGLEWEIIEFEVGMNGGISFPDERTLVVTGQNQPSVILSEDLGQNWIDISPPNSMVIVVHFISELTGWIKPMSYISVMKTEDKGETWELLDGDDRISSNHPRIYFYDNENGWLLSPLLRTRDGGASWENERIIIDYLDDIFYLNETNIWGVVDGSIFRYVK